MCRPFVKWAGGKRQLIEELLRSRPPKYKRYLEPFIGGGALFFALKPKNAFISDINEELINIYRVVKEDVGALIAELRKHEGNYREGDPQEYFYTIRNSDRESGYAQWGSVEKAARLIFLNKTCFNGLFRMNSRKQFNTPFGFYDNPAIVDERNLLACSHALKTTEIAASGFDHVVEIAQKGDFVYFDPPYVPLTATANFTSYTGEGFDLEMQTRLRDVCVELDGKGVKWMLSNSHSEFVLDLYKDTFHIRTVEASRAINCKADKRGKVAEVIVTNYEVSRGTALETAHLA
ncbi:MAG: DNA adenine methylase [Geobacteraceae bacterium]|nr:DNA adenine methylase [Geobacteraceae bacterium]